MLGIINHPVPLLWIPPHSQSTQSPDSQSTQSPPPNSSYPLQEELKRGYFDNLIDLNKKQGRVFDASQSLIPVSQALVFPQIQVVGCVFG